MTWRETLSEDEREVFNLIDMPLDERAQLAVDGEKGTPAALRVFERYARGARQLLARGWMRFVPVDEDGNRADGSPVGGGELAAKDGQGKLVLVELTDTGRTHFSAWKAGIL